MRGHRSPRPPRLPRSPCHCLGKPPALTSWRGLTSHRAADRKSGPSEQALRKNLQFQGRGQCPAILRLSDSASTLPQGHVALLASHIQIGRPGSQATVVVSEPPGEEGGRCDDVLCLWGGVCSHASYPAYGAAAKGLGGTCSPFAAGLIAVSRQWWVGKSCHRHELWG